VADYFGVEHVAVEITADGFLEELDLMQKFFRNPRYNVWPVFLFKAAREWGSQILITGEGADEIFGYPDRSYLEGWAGQLEWVQPAWVASATATGMQLLQPYLALALGGDYAALYMPPTKERLRELYVDLLPDWILLAASKPPSHPFYAMMAQAWGVAAPSPNYRTFEVVKRKMQLLACQAWIDAWKGSA
jgi:asparagine synthetase B (glutamine-hydrolysing)